MLLLGTQKNKFWYVNIIQIQLTDNVWPLYRLKNINLWWKLPSQKNSIWDEKSSSMTSLSQSLFSRYLI